MVELSKYSMGIGDRFAQQGVAQLQAFVNAQQQYGITITPVWNKSYREHCAIGSQPLSVRQEADQAVQVLQWQGPYLVDADHIQINTVEDFIEPSDFFTIDVANYIGKSAPSQDIEKFLDFCRKYMGNLKIPGLACDFLAEEQQIRSYAEKYLAAVQEAGKIYRHIKGKKQEFATEISMDETDTPQTPLELFFILAAVAMEGIAVQTIAPKFTGRFNKGVDYVGDLQQFRGEFEADVLVIAYAVAEFGLPQNLKLSIHSGSDKFSLYPIMREIMIQHNAGIHLKTAGTTWLEELIGLALSGQHGCKVVHHVFAKAMDKIETLCAPYASVIDIDTNKLPSLSEVRSWSGEKLARVLRHDASCSDYNPHFRQLLHIAYKIAADMGQEYLDILQKNKDIVAQQVTANIWQRHIQKLFGLSENIQQDR